MFEHASELLLVRRALYALRRKAILEIRNNEKHLHNPKDSSEMHYRQSLVDAKRHTLREITRMVQQIDDRLAARESVEQHHD
jgi:hypothetical protein